MIYPKRLLDINLQFAQKVASVVNKPLKDVLFDYTLLYRSFNIGRKFNVNHPFWINYLYTIEKSVDVLETTYKLHLMRQNLPQIDAPKITFGCFHYEFWSNQRIRIHFSNNNFSEIGPLNEKEFHIRMSELKEMFMHIKDNVKLPTTIVGRTWLYNLDAYRRLFPPSYLATAQICKIEQMYPRIALWGQFLDHLGLLKEDLAKVFIDNLSQVNKIENLKNCFHFQALLLEAPVQKFYEFYGL